MSANYGNLGQDDHAEEIECPNPYDFKYINAKLRLNKLSDLVRSQKIFDLIGSED